MDIIEAEGKKFIDGDERFPGCVKNGYDRAKAEALWAKMARFGEYAFNKSHAACYAAISMQTAYLKAHYPAEFFAGLLTSVCDQTKKLTRYIVECRKNGLEIKNPDVNSSEINFESNSDGSVTYGLSAIKGIGKIADTIIAERKANGAFTGLSDFIKRIPSANKKAIESLIKAGAFDSFGYHRSTLLANIESTQKAVRKTLKDQTSGQLSLFELFENEIPQETLIEISEYDRNTLLKYEKEATGLYVSGHPFEEFQILVDSEIQKNPSTTYVTSEFFEVDTDTGLSDDDNEEGFDAAPIVNDVKVQKDQKVILGGIMTEVTRRITKKGSPMATFELEDVYGTTRMVCFPKTFELISDRIIEDQMVFIEGIVLIDDETGKPSVSVKEIYGMDDYPFRICMNFESKEEFDEMKEKIMSVRDTYPGNSSMSVYINKRKSGDEFLGFDVAALPVLREMRGQHQVLLYLP